MRVLRFEVFAVAAVLSTSAFAGDLSVTGDWIRVLPMQLPAAGYFDLRNAGRSEVVLTGASSPACGMLMLHRSVEANGVSKMEDVDRIAIKARTTLAFAPGGFHLMCMDPTNALKPGVTVPVTLDFADGTSLSAPFAVRNANGK